MQGGLEDQGLEHQGLDPQDLDHQAQYADHQAHHMLDPQTQHMLDASLGHAGHPGLAGVHLDPHGGMDQQVLDSHALGHHPGLPFSSFPDQTPCLQFHKIESIHSDPKTM